MLVVNVFPDTTSRHVSHVLTGLSELAANKQIKLRYKTKFDGYTLEPKSSGILFFEVLDEDSGSIKKVCVDMMDSGKVIFDDRLALCDVYFKRSYDADFLDSGVDASQRHKVKPYGLYFACKSIHHKSEYEYLYKYVLLNKKKFFSDFSSLKRAVLLFKNPVKSTLYKLGLVKSFSYLVDPRSYESEPDQSSSSNVMYFTRVWERYA